MKFIEAWIRPVIEHMIMNNSMSLQEQDENSIF
jgi:hypothetical protein